MSTAEVFPFPEGTGNPRDDGSQNIGSDGEAFRRPNPTYARRQAIKARLCEAAVYDRTEPFVHLAIDHCCRSGLPQSQWVVSDIVGNGVAKPHIREGEELLRHRIAHEVVPELDQSAENNVQSKANLDTLDTFPNDLSADESGAQYSGQCAADRVGKFTDKIEDDRTAGLTHHERVPRWQQWLRKLAPWADALGLLVFLTIYLNVPVFAPWVDPLSWTVGVIIVLAVTFGLKLTVSRSAKAFNAWREQSAERQNHEVEKSCRIAIRYGIFAGAIALVVAGTLVQRGSLALGDVSFAVNFTMVSLAMITGIVVPALAWWAEAHDGSSVSRERDQLARDLNHDYADHQDLREEYLGNKADSEDIEHRVLTDILPRIVDGVQSVVNNARHDYAWLLVQIGNTEQPPDPQPLQISSDLAHPVGSISTGIPGADSVDLQVLWDVLARLHALRSGRAAIDQRYQALARHPWDHSANTAVQ
jgi:hypothetical protein